MYCILDYSHDKTASEMELSVDGTPVKRSGIAPIQNLLIIELLTKGQRSNTSENKLNFYLFFS
jgi:hypothetical protein